MSLIFDRHPGEWHGNKSISLVNSHLLRIYKPVSNFELCLFGDETVYLDKIKKAGYAEQLNWLRKQEEKMENLSEERRERVLLIRALF